MKFTKKLIALILCVMFAFPAAFSVSAQEVEYAVFGAYPQSEAAETIQLKNATYDQKGDAVVGDHKYRRVQTDDGFRYFVYEPVVWQKCGSTLVSVSVLDCKMYDEQEEKIKDFMGGIKYANSVTWEECSIRGWLNNDFSSTAFTIEERENMGEEARLLTVAEAKTIEKSMLCKNTTDYAATLGIEPKNNNPSYGDCEWLLKDISPIVSSTVCTVRQDGSINTGMTVLVNEKGMGVVPCITVKDVSKVPTYTQQAPESTQELYRPGGRTELFAESQVQEALASGWYDNKDDAMYENGIQMKARFQESSLNSAYDWRLSNLKGSKPVIHIDAPRKNMTPSEVITFVKPLMDAFFTGNMDDYMSIYVSMAYTKEVAASFDEFSDTVGKSIHSAVEGYWSGWGNLTCSDHGAGRAYGTSGAEHSVTLKLKLNGDGAYSVGKTNYNRILHELAREAKAYSERPLGHLQYLRYYFGQNTIYDGRQFNNEPATLIENGVGICGSYANFAADFCKLLGIPCLVYTNESASHAWNGVYLEGKWYHMDHTGTDDKEYMRNFYANYSVNGEFIEFDVTKDFPASHKADNVSFLGASYLPIDNFSEADLKLAQSLLLLNGNNSQSSQQQPQQSREITVWLNGEKLAFDVVPMIENGRTLVPMRKIFESLGATVYWNGVTQTVTAVRGTDVITVTVDSMVMTKNGENISLDVPARLMNSRTLVPVRVIAESFGLNVSWNGVDYTVTISG